MKTPSPVTASPEAVASGASWRAWGLVGLLWVAFLINYIDRQVVFSIFPVLRRDLGFTSEQLGLIGTIFIWVYSLCNPLVGRLADVFSRQKLIVASLVLWSFATLGTGFSYSVGAFLMWRAVMGVTEAMYIPPAMAIIGTLHSGATRSLALALHGTAQFSGIVVGSWFGGWMADRTGWRSAFFILAGVGLLYAPVLIAVLRGSASQMHMPGRSTPAPVSVLLRSRTWFALAFAFFSFCIMLWMIYAWLPNHVYEKMGLSMAEAGLTASFWVQISNVIGNLTGGFLGDRLSRRVPSARFIIICIGLTLCAPFAWLTMATASLATLKVTASCFGLFAGFMSGNVFAACCDVMPVNAYGLSIGTLNMVGGISGGAAIFVAGRFKDTVGIHGLMGWAAALAIVSAILLAFTVWRRFDQDYCSPKVIST
ncbi:MAG: MFS transporter [Bryobacteraceae bacterium]